MSPSTGRPSNSSAPDVRASARDEGVKRSVGYSTPHSSNRCRLGDRSIFYRLLLLAYDSPGCPILSNPTPQYSPSRPLEIVQTRNTGKTPGVAALFSCTGSGEPDSSYV